MPPPVLEAAEIIKRSAQGVCRPFLIRDMGGDVYVVKGMQGPGPAFASKLVENVTTLIYQQVPQVDPDLQLRVLVFDKWIRNGDRQLTAKGGNANLLVCKEGNLVVIDHNMAFDMSEDDRNLLASHVFIGQAAGPDDLGPVHINC